MPIEDVFTISGRVTVVTGRVERGQLAVNFGLRSLVSVRPSRPPSPPSRPSTDHGRLRAGGNTSLLLLVSAVSDVERGQVVASRAPLPPHQVRGRSLRADQGRRRPSLAVLLQLPPQFYFPHHRRHRRHRAAEGVADGSARRHATFTVELRFSPIAMEKA